MKVENNKIVEATELELFIHWEENWYMFMPFDEYLRRMKSLGVKINDSE